VTAFLINDDEWDRLFDEPSDLLKVYCALRRVMDFETGITGFTYRVNEGFFIDLMKVELIPGRHRPDKFTRGKIRNHLNRLEKIGLIRRRGDIGPFVFELLLSQSDKSVQNRMSRGATKAAAKKAAEQQPDKTELNQGTYDAASADNKNEDKAPNPERMNPPPVSVYIDRYTRMSELHNALKIVVPENWLVRADDRKIMNAWLSLGIGSEILNKAIERAMHSKQGQSFGVRYLDPVVRQLKQQSNHGGNHETGKPVRQSSVDRNEKAAEDYMSSIQQSSSEHGSGDVDGELMG